MWAFVDLARFLPMHHFWRPKSRFVAALLAFVLLGCASAQASKSAAANLPLAANLAPSARFQSKLAHSAVTDSADRALIRAALIAGGITAGGITDNQIAYDARLEKCLARYERFAVGLERAMPRDASGLARARFIHERMHTELLVGGYREDENELANLLDRGTFNCLTASLVFIALAARSGIDATAIAVPGHVRCLVVDGGQRFAIETTSPDWFTRPSALIPLDAASAERPAGDASEDAPCARPLTPRRLVAALYYNRGVRSLLDGHFAEASAANRLALAVDPAFDDARDNLCATLNNWSVALASAGQTDEAAAKLAALEQIDPDYGPLVANRRYLSAVASGNRPSRSTGKSRP